jgi:hypothetical protein
MLENRIYLLARERVVAGLAGRRAARRTGWRLTAEGALLLNINPPLTGELLKRIDEIGHSDYLVIGDANFPAHRLHPRAAKYPGTTASQVAAALCEVLPLNPTWSRCSW